MNSKRAGRPRSPKPRAAGRNFFHETLCGKDQLVRLCMDRNLIRNRQFLFSATALEECGRMVGGWAKSIGGSTSGGEGAGVRSRNAC